MYIYIHVYKYIYKVYICVYIGLHLYMYMCISIYNIKVGRNLRKRCIVTFSPFHHCNKGQATFNLI